MGNSLPGVSSPRYDFLGSTFDEEESVDEEIPKNLRRSRTGVDRLLQEQKNVLPKRWLLLNIVLLGLSSTMFILSVQPNGLSPSRNNLLRQFSMPSPVLDKLDVTFAPKRMDATLLRSEPVSIFRKEPSDEVDLAWRKIGDTRPIPISRENVIAIGKDPAQAVKIPESWGLGTEMYFGRLDVLHQIHCLDALRREAYFDYYYGKKYPNGFQDTGEFHRLHLSHCVYLLLQNIMCSANTDIYTHIWTDTLEHPFPDFNINHQCKNFDSILSWQDRMAVNETAFVDLKRPENQAYRVMNHKFKEIHGWFADHEDDGDWTNGELG